jgi:hypothetical protein
MGALIQVARLKEEVDGFEVAKKEHEDNKAVLSTSIKSNHQLSEANSELLEQIEVFFSPPPGAQDPDDLGVTDWHFGV